MFAHSEEVACCPEVAVLKNHPPSYHLQNPEEEAALLEERHLLKDHFEERANRPYRSLQLEPPGHSRGRYHQGSDLFPHH
jgi:hypothetical protein